jgi:hypothetical protein
MIQLMLMESLRAWKTPAFTDVLKEELEGLDVAALPLQQGLAHSSYALEDKFQVMIISVSEESNLIRVKTGIFYSGLIPGCSCADDPTPATEYSEYCEVSFVINKITADTTVTLLPT